MSLAVSRVQTACEMWIRQTLTELLAARDPDADPATRIPRSTTLCNSPAWALMHELTGQHIQQEPLWPAYTDHVKRRDAIIHSAAHVTREDSFRSLEVSVELRQWLLEARGVDCSDVARAASTDRPDDD